MTGGLISKVCKEFVKVMLLIKNLRLNTCRGCERHISKEDILEGRGKIIKKTYRGPTGK